MARRVILSRDDAEYLVDILEGREPLDIDNFLNKNLASYFRECFGMCTKERQDKRLAKMNGQLELDLGVGGGPLMAKVVYNES